MFASRTIASKGLPRLFRTPAGLRTGVRMFSESATKRTENEFIKERQHIKAHAVATTDLWKKISVYLAIPLLILSGANAYRLWKEHWDHWDHMPPLEERVEYPYQNIRSKNYPWGDGDKTLFWNDKVNYHKKDKAT
ncbi:Cytochrome c oxidase subunit 6A mitochondrial [Zalerion maritima]|uniref:Cytochrome c oxidase subunit n=1 Tax=Zalerion maritima TaxID=339359 RepID=A0AAD5RTN4_9PEZI|nr:Cytochrome c oxidase subunit 6A mitochondrial [Zalerion maritima]